MDSGTSAMLTSEEVFLDDFAAHGQDYPFAVEMTEFVILALCTQHTGRGSRRRLDGKIIERRLAICH